MTRHISTGCEPKSSGSGGSVPRAGPPEHKTGVISDSRPGPLLINYDVIVPQGTSVEVIVLRLQHEASTRYY